MSRKMCARFLALVVMIMMSGADLLAQTRRIVFRRGATSATVTGSLGAVKGRDFVLGASSGQRLTARISSSGGCVEFYVGRGTDTLKRLSYITDSGSNYITITNNCNRQIAYKLTVAIK
jgi:hypothetical protein